MNNIWHTVDELPTKLFVYKQVDCTTLDTYYSCKIVRYFDNGWGYKIEILEKVDDVIGVDADKEPTHKELEDKIKKNKEKNKETASKIEALLNEFLKD